MSGGTPPWRMPGDPIALCTRGCGQPAHWGLCEERHLDPQPLPSPPPPRQRPEMKENKDLREPGANLTTSAATPGGAAGELTVEAIEKMLNTPPKPVPTVVVSHPHIGRGASWKIIDNGTTYFFVHPLDIAALPSRDRSGVYAPTDLLGATNALFGIPVREFEGEAREVFIRGLERLAEAEAAREAHRPTGAQLSPGSTS